MSDREKSGLHGPVRTCVEEAILPDNIKHLTTRNTVLTERFLFLQLASVIRTAQSGSQRRPTMQLAG
jgi:hypothetical protein